MHAIKFKTEWSSLSLASIPNLLELIKADEIEISTEGKVKAKVFLFSKTVNLKRTDMVKIKK